MNGVRSAGLATAGAVASLGVAGAVSGHEPVAWWSVVLGLSLAGFGCGAIIQGRWFRWLLAGAAAGAGVFAISAARAGNPQLGILGSPFAASIVVCGQALAMVLVRVLVSHAGALTRFRVAGCAVLAVSFLPLPYALLARHFTVRVEHSERGAINAHVPGFRGVELGDTASVVTQIMGPAPRWTLADRIGPLADASIYDGPSALDFGGPPRDTFLRYAGASFAIRNGRVRWIQIDNQSYATIAGLGPGDSISLVRHFYPTARCGEDAINSETSDLPYPYCRLRLRPHRWLTFFATYRQPGTPISGVWLTSSPVQ